MKTVCVTVRPEARQLNDIAQPPQQVASLSVRLTKVHYCFALVVL